jgi:C4-dicarboxylate-specific signal transduction histidine kinase
MNLLSNARHAVGRREDARVRVAVRRVPGGVAIEISDNGVGISPENAKKIFVHGFTTMKDGHGFGLHSSALAARELGGSLSCYSDGEGKGATFILELSSSEAALAS